MSSSNLPLGAVAQPSPSPLGTPSLPEGPARPPPGALRSLKARAQSAKASRANSTPFGFVAAPHLRTGVKPVLAPLSADATNGRRELASAPSADQMLPRALEYELPPTAASKLLSSVSAQIASSVAALPEHRYAQPRALSVPPRRWRKSRQWRQPKSGLPHRRSRRPHRHADGRSRRRLPRRGAAAGRRSRRRRGGAGGEAARPAQAASAAPRQMPRPRVPQPPRAAPQPTSPPEPTEPSRRRRHRRRRPPPRRRRRRRRRRPSSPRRPRPPRRAGRRRPPSHADALARRARGSAAPSRAQEVEVTVRAGGGVSASSSTSRTA